MEADAKMLE